MHIFDYSFSNVIRGILLVITPTRAECPKSIFIVNSQYNKDFLDIQ